MTSKDIADRLAAARGISKAEARATVTAVLDAIADGIAGGDVALAGFGRFSVSRRGARPGRNPRSGETIVIGPSSRVGFRAAKGLKDRLDRR
ncbi:HU family DNA-binding protein [Sphingomonas sp. ACRSK]|uniref:HU family DNA-binding protein n=1 Tax=Sphingomonas sp. ACRSK TaxID=2918213 RepID=UPI001EF6068F|nr:HU family DNA-binding protein [Sphingomonas sp. ACRSK]MCG7349430.1 HU family DNA-binding protein [Sphingomonas sp. ACRSK]